LLTAGDQLLAFVATFLRTVRKERLNARVVTRPTDRKRSANYQKFLEKRKYFAGFSTTTAFFAQSAVL
jgi:hypothetical protein